MKFKSSKNLTIKLTFIIVILILIGTNIPIWLSEDKWSSYIVTLINVSLIILLIWIYLKTEYIIKKDVLICKTAFIKKKIDINTIKKITFHNGIIIPSLCKFSTDTKGIIITYNNNKDIFISPEERNKFIQEITSINSNIRYIN